MKFLKELIFVAIIILALAACDRSVYETGERLQPSQEDTATINEDFSNYPDGALSNSPNWQVIPD